jgi:hypothetical protein
MISTAESLGPTPFNGTPVPLNLRLRYPLQHLPAIVRGQEDGWEVRWREPWIEMWRSSVLHAYSLRLQVDHESGTFFFPESWISPCWSKWSDDHGQHQNLVLGILDFVAGFDTSFTGRGIAGKRTLEQVKFSGSARTLEDVAEIATTLRDQVVKMQQGRDK